MKIFELIFIASGYKMCGRTTGYRNAIEKEVTNYINAKGIVEAMEIMDSRYVIITMVSVKQIAFIVTEDKYEY